MRHALPPIHLPTVSLACPQQRCQEPPDDFTQGYLLGKEAAWEDRASGNEPKTTYELWAFLESEFHPRHLEREEQACQLRDEEPPSLSWHAGFLAGYVCACCTEQQSEDRGLL